MTTGAIRTDVPAGSDQTPQSDSPLNDPAARYSRADAMKMMTASRRQTVARDMDPDDAEEYLANAPAISTPAPTSDDPDEAAAAAADAAVEAERARLTRDAQQNEGAETRAAADQLALQGSERVLDESDLDSMRVRRKVNGREEVVSVRDVLTSAQKVDAADEYLNKAKRTLAEIDAVALQARTAAAAPAHQPASTDTTEGSTGSQDDPIEKALEAVFQGDPAQAAKLLRTAIDGSTGRGGSAQGGVDVGEIEQRIVIRSALRQFAKDHKEIAGDPLLRKKADEFLYEATGGRQLTDFDADQIPELLETAGTRTKEWLRKLAGVPAQAGGQPAPSVQLQNDRRERKNRIDEPPIAAMRSASSVAPPPTTSDTIARMSAQRNPMASGQRPGSR